MHIGLITFFVLCLDAFYEIYNGSNILNYSSVKGRLAGLFGDRWLLGRYLIYILPILVGMYYFEKDKFKNGKYELVFFIGDYFKNILNTETTPFLDDVIIRFGISKNNEHYHVPLLVSPWSYSTYRGS